MSDPRVELGFNTPFAEQIVFFRQKLNLPTERWDDIMRAAHDRAFIVAGAMKADLLADLNTAVGTAITEGKSIGWFRDNFKAIVKKHGWTGWTGEGTPAGEAWRTRVIYQTNLSTSYAAGRYTQLTDPELLKLRPYWRYKHADGVANPRLQHVAWNGLTLPHDHPFWQTHFPPNGWGCHCSVSAVSKREFQKAEAGGLAEPPAGWDAIDEKTGAPQGIAKGFDYAPGASVADELRILVAAKADQLPKPLSQAFSGAADPVLDNRGMLEKALERISAEIAEQPVEHLAVVDGQGVELVRQVGTGSMVQLSNDALAKLGDAVLIHNHPGIPQSFSIDDVHLAVWHRLQESHVVDRLYHYAIARPAGAAWGPEFWSATLAPVISRVESDVVKRLDAAESAGLISAETRAALTDHMIWEEVNAEVNIGYHRTLRKTDGQ